MTAWYNENDPAAAHVLRALIAENVIAPGDVDERSITEVTANDVKGYTQQHYFAGGGFWSVAARLAGWPDDRPLVSGSCPCQPFSAAGKHKGTDDPRHLWPHFYRLIRETRPDIVVGEQVSGKAGYGWLDGVCDDLEAEGYTCGAIDTAACAIDAPHQRSRLYWWGRVAQGVSPDTASAEQAEGREIQSAREQREHQQNAKLLANPAQSNELNRRHRARRDDRSQASNAHVASYWSTSEWVECYDGKTRRTQPNIRFLVDGLSLPLDVCCSGSVARLQEAKKAEVIDGQVVFNKGRIDLWRITGNAIVPELAAVVLRAI